MAGLRPGHRRFSCSTAAKTWMPGIADKFTQSAQRQTATAGHDELRDKLPFRWLLFESGLQGSLINSKDAAPFRSDLGRTSLEWASFGGRLGGPARLGRHPFMG